MEEEEVAEEEEEEQKKGEEEEEEEEEEQRRLHPVHKRNNKCIVCPTSNKLRVFQHLAIQPLKVLSLLTAS